MCARPARLLLAAAACGPGAGRRALRRGGRCHSRVADRHSRAMPRAAGRSSPTAASGFACCATAARSPRSASRATWRRAWRAPASRWSPGQLRLRWSMRARLNPDTIMPPYYRTGRPHAGRQEFPGQDHPDGRADRGRGGLSRDPEGVSMRHAIRARPSYLPRRRRPGHASLPLRRATRRRRRWRPPSRK